PSGDVDQAIAELKKAIELDSRFITAYQQLGDVAWAKRDLVEAVKAYEAILVVDPASVDARLSIARLYIAEGSSEGLVADAEQLARDAAAAAPSDPRPPLLLGQIALARGNLDAAEIQFNKAGAIAPDLQEGRKGLASVHLERCAKAV